MKHTEGPWNWYSPQGTASINPNGAAFLIGPTRLYMDKSCGFSVADAKLISAAPDLFKELSDIVDTEEQSSFEQWLSRVTPSGDCDSVQAQWLDSSEFEDFCDLWSGPIAALNKARSNNQ